MRIHAILFFAALVWIFAPVVSNSDPLLNPAITGQDIVYEGQFALSKRAVDLLIHGGRAVGYDESHDSLFVGCKWDLKSYIAEVTIPDPSFDLYWDTLPVASIIQPCQDVADGTATIERYDSHVKGTLVDGNGDLVSSIESYYDAQCQQTLTHGKQPGTDLSIPDDFTGYLPMVSDISGVDPRSLAGYMGKIPAEWRDILGGSAFTGSGGGAIVSCASEGPSLSVFNPGDIGASTPIQANTLLYYDYKTSAVADTYFYWKTDFRVEGAGIPSGSRTAVFVGYKGDNACYGDGTSDPNDPALNDPDSGICYDLCTTNHGAHGYPYHPYAWLYDVADLVAVKNGTVNPEDVVPYEIVRLDDIETFMEANGEIPGCTKIAGATMDTSNNLYVTPKYPLSGTHPTVFKYHVTIPEPYQSCVDQAIADCQQQFPQ